MQGNSFNFCNSVVKDTEVPPFDLHVRKKKQVELTSKHC